MLLATEEVPRGDMGDLKCGGKQPSLDSFACSWGTHEDDSDLGSHLPEEPFILAHQKLRLKLAQGVQGHTYHDEEAKAAKLKGVDACNGRS